MHDLQGFLQHIKDGHLPKLATCPVCQMADGPPYIHRRLEKIETGKLSIDCAGPLSDDLFGFRYLLIGVFVAAHDSNKIESESHVAPKKPQKRAAHKRRQELLLPFVRLLKTRGGSEVAQAVKNMILDVEAF
eukprot:5998958-Amphidinium_carterae.1